MRINTVACKNAYSQVVIGILVLISNGLASIFKCFINFLQVHFEYKHVLLDVQFQFQLIYNTYEKHEM